MKDKTKATWKDSLIPGFMGKAMRDQADTLSNIESDNTDSLPHSIKGTEGGHQFIPNDTKHEALDISKHMASIEENFQIKVISGVNGDELENSINKFLTTNPNIEVTNTNFATNSSIMYYTILYRTKTERV
jgi:hypothetical protein